MRVGGYTLSCVHSKWQWIILLWQCSFGDFFFLFIIWIKAESALTSARNPTNATKNPQQSGTMSPDHILYFWPLLCFVKEFYVLQSPFVWSCLRCPSMVVNVSCCYFQISLYPCELLSWTESFPKTAPIKNDFYSLSTLINTFPMTFGLFQFFSL